MTTNTAPKKLTQRDCYNMLLAIEEVANNEILVEFINHRIEQLDKKNTHSADGEKKPTAHQLANDSLREEILDCMEEGKGYTISDMIKTFPCCNGLSQSKVSAMLRPILTITAKGEINSDGVVERYEEKGKAYFKLA